jgi:membrane-associated protein
MIDWMLNLDKNMGEFIAIYGSWIYVLLGSVVFAETGLIFFAFLPGDTLLFAAGSYAASGKIDIWSLIIIVVFTAIIGNTVNALIARWIYAKYGDAIFSGRLKWLDAKTLKRTQDFYNKHGGKALILARFVPILRTFAPFVAGLSGMPWIRFQIYNILGAFLWGVGLLWLGFLFGNVPFIKNHLDLIILGGLGAAIVPTVIGLLWSFLRKNKNKNKHI